MKTNYRFSSVSARNAFLDEAAGELSHILGKPLPAVMLTLDECTMYMDSSEDTVFFAEFRYIPPHSCGSTGVSQLISENMLRLIRKHTNADPRRIYMQFTEMDRQSAWHYTG
jgi:hypothetical protein